MLAFIDPESRFPAHHPLRTIKRFADAALAELSPQFDALYAADGKGRRPSIPPERLLKASLLMSLFSVRSERAFCEALDYDLRYRWFLDMDMGRTQLRPLHVHQEPRTPAGRARQPWVLRRGGRAGRSAAPTER
jgi:transposase